jgi:hypothetical protein
MRGEIVDEGFHARMPESVEAEEVHFLQGLFGGPFLKSHAVSGDQHAGAVIAEVAMHKYFFLPIMREEGEKLRDLLVGRRRPAAYGDMHEAHPKRFGTPALPFDSIAIFAAQIHNCGYAQFLQFWKAFLMRLRATIERIVDLSGIRNSRNFQFLTEGQSGSWKSRRTSIRLSKKRKRKTATEQKQRKKASHSKLDAKSLARDHFWPKALKQRRLSGKSTTTNRHDTKTPTTFCVFLLTENF